MEVNPADTIRQAMIKKVIHTRSGTKVFLNDAEGSVFIEDPSGNTWLMDGKGNINVNALKDYFDKTFD
jgi:hypothetical protein